jgi:hypothetical protein
LYPDPTVLPNSFRSGSHKIFTLLQYRKQYSSSRQSDFKCPGNQCCGFGYGFDWLMRIDPVTKFFDQKIFIASMCREKFKTEKNFRWKKPFSSVKFWTAIFNNFYLKLVSGSVRFRIYRTPLTWKVQDKKKIIKIAYGFNKNHAALCGVGSIHFHCMAVINYFTTFLQNVYRHLILLTAVDISVIKCQVMLWTWVLYPEKPVSSPHKLAGILPSSGRWLWQS